MRCASRSGSGIWPRTVQSRTSSHLLWPVPARLACGKWLRAGAGLPSVAEEKESARLEAFSDGVFAFAITLLVLGVAVPSAKTASSTRDVLAAVLEARHAYFALLVTFATVYVMWMTHHAMFRSVRHVDGAILLANGAVLLLISSCAFPTALLAEYMDKPAAGLAAAFYAGYFLLVNVAFVLLGAAISRSLRVDEMPRTDLRLRQVRLRARWGFSLYLAAGLAALWSPPVAIAICAALWVFWGWVAFARHRHVHEAHAHG
jgi:uncharacterized membrane protein